MTAAPVIRKRTSGPRTCRRKANARRARKLDRKTRPTTCSNIFRWYRSGWGKYTQPDPVGLKAGANLYQYGNDNPGIYIDPLGTTKCKSGSCADCPGGVWVGTAGVAEAGVKFFGVGIGKVIFAGVLLCTSNLYLSVPFVTECTFFGGPMKKGIGVIAPEVGGAVVGCKGMKCKEDLAGPEEGVYGQAGPVYGFGEGTKTGGCVGFGAAEAGLYGGGFKCKTYIKE